MSDWIWKFYGGYVGSAATLAIEFLVIELCKMLLLYLIGLRYLQSIKIH